MAKFDRSQADNWVENGKLLDGVKEKLDNQAMGIKGAEAFSTTFDAPYRNPSGAELKEAYQLLNKQKKRLSRDGDRDYQQIISEYIADGQMLFVDVPPSEELLKYLKKRIGKKKSAPEKPAKTPDSTRKKQTPGNTRKKQTDSTKKKKRKGCWTKVAIVAGVFFLINLVGTMAIKDKIKSFGDTPAVTPQEATAGQQNRDAAPKSKQSSTPTTKSQQSAANSELEQTLAQLDKLFKVGADGRSSLEVSAEYQDLDGISRAGNLLRKAERTAPGDSRVQSYRRKFDSIMKKFGLT